MYPIAAVLALVVYVATQLMWGLLMLAQLQSSTKFVYVTYWESDNLKSFRNCSATLGSRFLTHCRKFIQHSIKMEHTNIPTSTHYVSTHLQDSVEERETRDPQPILGLQISLIMHQFHLFLSSLHTKEVS